MSRPVNPQRPAELEEATAGYLVKRGIAGLSLRPLAKAVGSSPRVLLYYFGSKEKMVARVLASLRRRQHAAFDRMAGPTIPACRAVWKQMSSPESEPAFRLFFEIYGLALRHPQRYRDFLRLTVQHWLDYIAAGLRSDGFQPRQARLLASSILAGLRGFMLDYCATHDRRRINAAVDLWLRGLTLIPHSRS